MSFESLGLSPEILRAVAEEGYTEPTPIQAQAIPVVLAGKDVQAAAQTGTGKTAGFTLPILNRLQPLASSSVSPAKHPIRCLVLTPTRELAAQVEASVKTYSKYVPLRSTVIYGGVNMDPQIKALMAGVEIVVATPGRLLDHVQQRTINFSQVEILVLDEADRMLDMGFIPDIRRIVALLPKKRQNLLFSATFSDDIKKLSSGILHDPVTIEVARRNATSELVRQVIYPVHKDRKRELLTHLIRTLPIPQAIVFCRTKHGANRLCGLLERDGINAAAIHSDKTQSHRTQSLEDFKAGTVNILVATDIAARGLDVDQMPYVVNYELPHVPEDYVHRIGRTGRAGSLGHAISLVSDEELRELADIEKLTKQKLERVVEEGFDSARPEGARAPRPERAARPERAPRAERPPRTERAPRPEVVEEAPDEPKVRREPEPERASLSRSHFSRPPLASLGKKPREVPALLGGLPKKPS
ncbi:MAG: DEAD/DEAH box helicase [Betaproteobacteria bacterium]|nr:DEAD/DEAH box helicase [Betaproteobacteria bacterium]